MRVLGVDPGLRTTGYGVVDADGGALRLIEAGVIEPDPKLALEERLAQLHRSMAEIVAEVRPDVMIVEELWSAYRNPSTAVLMGHARGVLYLAAAQQRVVVHPLAHSLVKRALVGSGAARKEQVKSMVVQLLRLGTRPHPDDVSDALALAIAWALRSCGGSAVRPAVGISSPKPSLRGAKLGGAKAGRGVP